MTAKQIEFRMDDYPAGFWSWVSSREGDQVWREFERRALKMAAVRTRYSAKSIMESIRWDTDLQGGDEFKINNNWTSGLARRWLSRHGKKHPKFFQIRDALGRDQ